MAAKVKKRNTIAKCLSTLGVLTLYSTVFADEFEENRISKISVPSTVQVLPFGETSECDRESLDRLSITTNYYSDFQSVARYCSMSESFGEYEYSDMVEFISEQYIDTPIENIQIAFANLYNDQDQVVETVMLSSTSLANGRTVSTCRVNRSFKSVSGTNFECYGENSFNLERYEDQILIRSGEIIEPLIFHNLGKKTDYPGQTLESLIDIFRSSTDENIQQNIALTLGSQASEANLEIQETVYSFLQEWRDNGGSESIYYAALGNMGSTIVLKEAKILLASTDIGIVRNGVQLIRGVQQARPEIINVIQRFYADSVSVDGRWGDFDSVSLISYCLSSLSHTGKLSDTEFETLDELRESTEGTNRDLERFLQADRSL